MLIQQVEEVFIKFCYFITLLSLFILFFISLNVFELKIIYFWWKISFIFLELSKEIVKRVLKRISQ